MLGIGYGVGLDVEPISDRHSLYFFTIMTRFINELHLYTCHVDSVTIRIQC